MARGPIPDKPRDRPTVPQVLEFAQAYNAALEQRGSYVWGPLHIALGDGNLEEGSIVFCAHAAIDEADVDGARLAGMLLAMTGTQRRKLYGSL
jgi:hypothetical protein